MADISEILARYHRALRSCGDIASTSTTGWPKPDDAEFVELRKQLLPHAESGNVLSQYAVATISWLGLCAKSQEEVEKLRATEIENATRWWIAAASQGYWPAVDNLITNRVGAEAEKLRAIADEIERDFPQLVGKYQNMPVYGPEFMQSVCQRAYGQLITDTDEGTNEFPCWKDIMSRFLRPLTKWLRRMGRA